jgi:phosphohistidine swiveling domain-containing protein
MTYVSPVQDFGHGDVDRAGGKGANLGELVRAGLPVPDAFVVTTDGYRAYLARNGLGSQIQALAGAATGRDGDHLEEIAQQIRALFSGGTVDEDLAEEILTAHGALGGAGIAVRSSATAEDLTDASFAGQQDTYLNVAGPDLLEAVTRCWASLWTARAMDYRIRQGVDPTTVSLAVVLQQLVDADAAGVMFTANPTSGRRSELVIGAAWGLGESVVGGSVNTDDVVVDKRTLAIVSRQTADKEVMTVRVEDGTEERPVPPERRNRPVLDDAEVVELARWGMRIEQHFGSPQDIEWARAGDNFAILQSRAITALPLPASDPPTEWEVPDPHALYFRASIVEQLPDPLSPLFADLIDPSVTRSLTTLMNEFLGRDVLGPHDVTMPTVNGYAYYAYSRGAMTRMLAVTPRALRLFTGGKLAAQVRWGTYSSPRYREVVERWTARPVEDLPASELLSGVVELLDAATEYYTSVQTIIPIAVTSETLFTRFYSTFVARPRSPVATTYLIGYDSVPILAEKSLYDLARWVRSEPRLTDELLATPVEEVVTRLAAADDDESSAWVDFRSRFQTHLSQFGHLVYNLDFINAVPADDPAPLVQTLLFYLRGAGTDPYERQAKTAARRDAATEEVLDRLDPVRRRTFLWLLRWAQRVAPVREDALADVGLAWPQLRRMLRQVGRRLVERGVIARGDDVFWLRWGELTALAVDLDVQAPGTGAGADPGAGSGGAVTDLADVVATRQELWRGQRRATPPQWLPAGGWMDKLAGLMPATSADQTGAVLTGVAASTGQVTAVARVLNGPEDFSELQPGEVLVAAITTPAWTSLFARAAAVVTDIGGPLSHGSIVAREYGIPAVLGTSVATRRIRSGQRVRVDGDTGRVTLLEDGDESEPPPPDAAGAATTSHPLRGIAVGAAGAATAVVLLRRLRRRNG